jgi:hypothetical protein
MSTEHNRISSYCTSDYQNILCFLSMLSIITSQQNSEKVCFLRTNARKLASLLAGLAICFHLLAVSVCHLPAVAAVVPH